MSIVRRAHGAVAVFHDRGAMEEAVRALELEGVERRRIRVRRADATGGAPRAAPESSTAISVGGALGSAVGGGLSLLSIALSGAELPYWAVVLRVLAAAAGGALVGALLAIVTSGLRTQSRYAHPSGYHDFVVEVRAADAATAESVRDLLVRAGGEPLAV